MGLITQRDTEDWNIRLEDASDEELKTLAKKKSKEDVLYIVIPAYNEEMNIERVATEWHDIVVAIGKSSRLLIADDGSKDNTYESLLKLKEKLPQLEVFTKPNSGHGATLLFLYRKAIDMGADYVFQTDSDGQTLPSEFSDFWKKRQHYAMVIGQRSQRKDGFSRVFVTKVLKLVLRMVFGINVTDANTPYRLMKRNTLKRYLPEIPKDFNLSNVMLSVLLLHYEEPVIFLPITFRERQGGENSINLRKITKIGWQAVKDFYRIKKSLR